MVAFALDDIDAVVARLRARGAELVGEVEHYEDSHRLCYTSAARRVHRRAGRADRLRARPAANRLASVTGRLAGSPDEADDHSRTAK
jgi:hypothetical protein